MLCRHIDFVPDVPERQGAAERQVVRRLVPFESVLERGRVHSVRRLVRDVLCRHVDLVRDVPVWQAVAAGQVVLGHVRVGEPVQQLWRVQGVRRLVRDVLWQHGVLMFILFQPSSTFVQFVHFVVPCRFLQQFRSLLLVLGKLPFMFFVCCLFMHFMQIASWYVCFNSILSLDLCQI